MSVLRPLAIVAGILTALGSGDTLAVNAIDAQSGTTLSIGASTATAITLGRTGITATLPGALAVTGTTTAAGAVYLDGGADRSTSSTWSLFATNGTSGTIGKTAATVTFPGNLTVSGTLVGSFAPILGWGSNAPAIASGATRYLYPGYMNVGASSSVIPLVMPRAGNMRNLFFVANAAGSGTGKIAYTVFKGANVGALASTALTLDAAMTSVTANDTTHSFTWAQGDIIALVGVGSGTVTTGHTNVTITAEMF